MSGGTKLEIVCAKFGFACFFKAVKWFIKITAMDFLQVLPIKIEIKASKQEVNQPEHILSIWTMFVVEK